MGVDAIVTDSGVGCSGPLVLVVERMVEEESLRFVLSVSSRGLWAVHRVALRRVGDAVAAVAGDDDDVGDVGRISVAMMGDHRLHRLRLHLLPRNYLIRSLRLPLLDNTTSCV